MSELQARNLESWISPLNAFATPFLVVGGIHNRWFMLPGLVAVVVMTALLFKARAIRKAMRVRIPAARIVNR